MCCAMSTFSARKLGLALVSEKTGEERLYRVIASDIPPKRKGRPARKVA
jgi:hypothetical protein